MKIIARPIVKFHENQYNHTIAYARWGKEIAGDEQRGGFSKGNFPSQLANGYADVIDKLRERVTKNIHGYLNSRPEFKKIFSPSDFTFDIFYTNVEDDGTFWDSYDTSTGDLRNIKLTE